MDDINKQIEEMAEKMEKSTTSATEKLFSVIKSLGKDGLKTMLPTLSDEDKVVLKAALEEMNLKKAISFDDAYQAKFVQGNIKDTIIQEDKADDDQDEKLVKPAAAKMNHQGTPTDGWQGQVIKSVQESDEQFEQFIEKAMEKCKDDKMVMKKLKEKGMDESKVQGALDKYKMKKSEIEKAKKIQMDKKDAIKEHERLVGVLESDDKKDDKKEASKQKKELKDMKKADDKLSEAIDEAAEKEAKEEVKDHEKKMHKKDMKKSVSWEDETRLLKANTQGRNFHFNVEQFVNETIANEPKPEETVAKSEGKEDLNDLIKAKKDKSWNQVDGDKAKEEAKKKENGKLVKSFSDEDLRTAMGLTEEEYKAIVGE